VLYEIKNVTFIFPVPIIGESVRKRKSSVNLMKKWDAVIVKNTIFTGMQNNPDTEMTPPPQMQLLQGKNILLLISYA